MTIRNMSGPGQILKEINFKDDPHFTYFNQLAYEEVKLRFSKVSMYTDTENFGYDFTVQYLYDNAGTLTAVIKNNFEDDVEVGNIGLLVAKPYRGLEIPFRAVKEIAPLWNPN